MTDMRKYINCVGEGWHPLVLALIESIEEYLLRNPEYAEKFEVHQVKEKFGGLRFYCFPADDYVWGLVRMAERASLMLCEDCGAPGKIERPMRFWIKTLCKECLNARLEQQRHNSDS